jgi:hypothetical protein
MTISKQQQIYQDLLNTTADPKAATSKSVEWLTQQTSRSLSQVSPQRIVNIAEDRLVSQITVGRMYLFAYDPKTKEDLPYYDKFPLIFPFRRVKGGFYGINMHYLPPLLRAKLMDQLYSLANNLNFDDSMKLKLSYNILNSASKFKYFTPCVKHYLNSHVRSRFISVPADAWDRVLFLPLERFVGASKQQVYRDSRNKVRG